MLNATSWLVFPQERDPLPLLHEAAWAPGPVPMGAENLANTGIRSLDCSASSVSLYNMSYNPLNYAEGRIDSYNAVLYEQLTQNVDICSHVAAGIVFTVVCSLSNSTR